MNFREEMKERMDRMEREFRDLAQEMREFHRDFVKIEEKRTEIATQIREAHTAERSKLYAQEYKETEDEDFAGEVVSFRKVGEV